MGGFGMDEKQRDDVVDDQGDTDNRDSNEDADEKVEILQPDGSPAPRAG